MTAYHRTIIILPSTQPFHSQHALRNAVVHCSGSRRVLETRLLSSGLQKRRHPGTQTTHQSCPDLRPQTKQDLRFILATRIPI